MSGTTPSALECSARRQRGGSTTGFASRQASGAECVVGVDEVGRGCLAGPLLVVAARQTGPLPDGLKDSKLMTRKEREEMFDLLAPQQNLSGAVGNRIAEHQVFAAGLSISCQFGEGWVKASEIDKRGLARGLRLGVARALRALQVQIDDEIIMDGPINYLPRKFRKVTCLIDADATVPLVSAASIYAKVKRDNFMRELKKHYPHYGFEYHVGYGTPGHRRALQQFGALPKIHRMSFQPLRQIGLLEI